MKSTPLRFSLTALAILSLSLIACSKKPEPVPAPAPVPPPPAPTASVDPAPSVTDAANAKLAAAKKDFDDAATKAKADTATETAKLQALADQQAAETKKMAADIKTKSESSASAVMNKAASFSAAPADATTGDTATQNSLLTGLAKNLNPANFSSWYEQASQESSGIIASLATKAAELGSSASPDFKSLYDSALVQKKNFDDVVTKLKTSGISQWTELYPTLQSSWSELSKSLVSAKALLAQYNK